MNVLQRLIYDLRAWGYDDGQIAEAVGTTQETICRIRNGEWAKSKYGLQIALFRDKVARARSEKVAA